MASERCVGPEECTLLTGVPMTRDDFLARWRRSRGYIRHVATSAGWSDRHAQQGWVRYEAKVVRPLEVVESRVASLGVTVVRNAELSDVGAATERAGVVTVFAHCETSGGVTYIDLARRVWTATDLAEALQPTFRGVLELALCQSVLVQRSVKERCPLAMVIVQERTVRPSFRAGFYGKTIEFLAHERARYTDTVFELARAIMK